MAKRRAPVVDRGPQDALDEAYGQALQGGAAGPISRAEKVYLESSGAGQRQYDVIQKVRSANKRRGIDVSKFR